jgi:hypothetical protein
MATSKNETASPILRLPWQRGEDLLTQGYTVRPMDRPWCYEVIRPTPTNNPDGPTTSYHVCVDEMDSAFGCSCPDHARHGDIRPCKHLLGVYVQLWRWAEESPLRGIVDFTPVLDSLGIPAMREAALRSAEYRAPLTPSVSHSGRPLERRDPAQYQRPWPRRIAQKESGNMKERVTL